MSVLVMANLIDERVRVKLRSRSSLIFRHLPDGAKVGNGTYAGSIVNSVTEKANISAGIQQNFIPLSYTAITQIHRLGANMNISRLSGRLGALVRSFAHDRRGNYAIIAAITSLPLLTSVAVAMEYANASRMRSELQQRLDAAVLAGASHGNAQIAEAERFFRATFQDNSENQSADGAGSVIKAGFSLGEGVLDGWASRPMEPMFGFGRLTEGKEISVVSQARFFVSEAGAPCIPCLPTRHRRCW